jgi:arylsulfatase A-like enzyme
VSTALGDIARAFWRSLPRVCGIAVWFGLVAGLLEATIFTVIRFVPGWITYQMRQTSVSLDFLWIAPLVNLATFLACALAVAAAASLAAALPRLRVWTAERWAVFAFVWLTGYVALHVPNRLYGWAVIPLSLGLAARTAPALSRRLEGARLSRSLVRLVATVAVVGVLVRGGYSIGIAVETRALPEPPSGAPDVLLVVLDTLRADHLSVYGHHRQTSPNIDRLAAEGVLFEWAMASSSWTLPSHASLFTGRPVHEHGADNARLELDDRYPTVAEAMAASGYLTLGISANVDWATSTVGLARGFIHFKDYFGSVPDALMRTITGRFALRALRVVEQFPSARRDAKDVTDGFLRWVDRYGDRPYFAFLNYIDAHEPYTSPLPFHTRFMTERQGRPFEEGRRLLLLPPLPSTPRTPEYIAVSEAAYDGGIAYLDHEFGRLVDVLRQRGRLDRTIIVIVSDHGEAWGEHGLYGHGHSAYLDQIRVPLIWRLPAGMPLGLRVATPVSINDVAATILALVGQTDGGGLSGRSLSRYWSEPAPGSGTPAAVLSEVGYHAPAPVPWPVSAGWVRSLVVDRWHVIEQQDGRVELYDVRQDPLEARDLAAEPHLQSTLAELKARLAAIPATLDAKK